MTIKDIFSIAASIVISVGGIGAIIFGLSKWLGDLIANQLLEKYKFSHEKDLENLKKEYQKELEVTKNELDKTTSLGYWNSRNYISCIFNWTLF